MWVPPVSIAETRRISYNEVPFPVSTITASPTAKPVEAATSTCADVLLPPLTVVVVPLRSTFSQPLLVSNSSMSGAVVRVPLGIT